MLSPLKRAFLALEDAEARIKELENAGRAPVAVIGMGCRIPGAHGPAAFWRLLEGGVDATGPVPADRWDHAALYDPDPERPGRIAARGGGFLDSVDRFDAGLFGIAPREAQGIDPQQRLFLETAWEALEHAGQAPDALAGTQTGVFCGVTGSDYAYLQLAGRNSALLDAHFASGIAHSILTGRLSYLLGLQGPSVTVDTACSSSLVAVHQAVQSLRRGETRLALAGGVNLILSPEIYIALSRARMLAPDGRCKTFDARADGFARGEGCGVVVLKRLDSALADGDRVLAVIRGTAVNQDGASSGLTAPSGPAQEAVIRAALADAGLSPVEVSYVEAHGTGTELGDPQEMRALGNVFAGARTAPLLVGSVKTNLGHLEAAAGVTGLMKLVLMLRAGTIAPHLHFETPSPHIPWADLPLRVPVATEPWMPAGERRIAGISSFGFSGTNAHLIIEAAEPQSSAAAPGRAVLSLSAATAEALEALAQRHADAIAERRDGSLADLCRTLNAGRAHLAWRATVSGDSPEEILAGLEAVAERRVPAARVRATPKVAFLFTGQGAQFAGMGRGLYEGAPMFRAILDRAAAHLGDRLGAPLLDVMFAEGAAARRLDETGFTQPALFVLEHALAELWRSWGIEPDFVLGHSVGEFAAACAAGVMRFEQALDLVAERGRLMQALPAGGAMVSIAAPESEVAGRLGAQVAIAAINGPRQTVISGDAAAVAAVVASFEAEGVTCRALPVSHAFHSPLVDPALDAFEAAAAGIAFRAPDRRLISNLTGECVQAADIRTPRYWRRHMREPVRFAAGARALAALGADVLVEIGPHPVLIALAQEVLEPQGDAMREFVPSLRRGRDDWAEIQQAAAALWRLGAPVDWRAVEAVRGGRVTDAPTYPFAPERHWIPAPPEAGRATEPERFRGRFLAELLPVALDAAVWQGSATRDAPAYLADHRVGDTVLMPGAAFLAMLAGAARVAGTAGAISLEDIAIVAPLAVAEAGGSTLQTVRDAGEIVVFSRPADAAEAPWTRHASARLAAARAAEPMELSKPSGEPLDPATLYDGLAARGIALGHSFRVLSDVCAEGGSACGRVELSPVVGDDPDLPFHPLLLDGCFQLVAATTAVQDAPEATFLPYAADRLDLFAAPGRRVRCNVRVRRDGSEMLTVDITAESEDGTPVLAITGLRLRRSRATSALRAAARPLEEALYSIEWEAEHSLPPPAALVQATEPRREALAVAAELSAYDRFHTAFEAHCADLARNVLHRLGWTGTAGEVLAEDCLAERLGIAQRHRQLFGRLLAILAEEGDLACEAGKWRVVREIGPVDIGKLERSLRALAPEAASPEIDMVLRAHVGFAEALRGTRDPLELLFPEGATAHAEALYADVPTARYFNGLIAEIGGALGAAGRPLRVLEVGAGTGGTTVRLVEQLPEGTDYLFTDAGQSFVERARVRFADRPGMRFAVLDLERDFAEQGVAPNSIDLVVASNVVHATRNVAATLRRLRAALAPGGRLVLLEVTAPQRWFDLTVGLTPGWWTFADGRESPLLPRDRWLELLDEAGFGTPAALEGAPGTPGCRALQAIFVAGPGEARGRRWLVVPGAPGEAERLTSALAMSGETVVAVPDGVAADRAALAAFVEELSAAAGPPNEVVRCPGGDAEEAPETRVAAALALVQAFAETAPGTRVTFLTRGADAVTGRESRLDPCEATVAGLARSVRLELPEAACRRIDLDPDAGAEETSALAEAIVAPSADPELALRGGMRYAARLSRWRPAPAVAATEAPWRLVSAVPGTLDGLERQPLVRRLPGPGEIEIAVDATGLNFRDVLNALGMYPGQPPLGGECAGRVVAVGADVEDFAVGDAAVALVGGAFASHVTVAAALAAPLPDGFSMADGAGFAIPFVTADYCLRQLGGIAAGERVLIHAAAGGVGMAALQLARRAGAEVFATAGTPEKRALLRRLGAARTMDSRSAAFADDVLEATDGRGVDLVLNALTGELADAGFRALAPGGRFVELGLRDVRDEAWVAALGKEIRYFPVNWGEVAEAEPERIGTILRQLTLDLAAGRLAPLPRHTFGPAGIGAAFRLMAQAQHVGKIVVSWTGRLRPRTRRDGSYLITGGLSGLGLDTARRLAGEGAGRIVLTGRRGAGAEAEAAMGEMRASGTTVEAHAVDAADEAAMAVLLDRLRSEGPPIRGVIHAAGVLADAGVMQQGPETLRAVIAPKLGGAGILDRLTRGDPLDVFCAFSSIAGVLGSPGQLNHAAANAALGLLMRDRARRGLPGLAIDWGAWAEIGAAAADDTLARLAAQGIAALTRAEGRAACAYLIAEADGQVAVAPIDWRRIAERRGGKLGPFFDRVAAGAVASARVEPGFRPKPAEPAEADLPRLLVEAPPARRRAMLDAFLEETLRTVFALPQGRRIDPETPFGEMGLDSLLAVELRNRLGRGLDMRLPATLLFEQPTLAALGGALMGDLFPGDATAGGKPRQAPEEADDAFSGIEEMTEEELDRMLGLSDSREATS